MDFYLLTDEENAANKLITENPPIDLKKIGKFFWDLIDEELKIRKTVLKTQVLLMSKTTIKNDKAIKKHMKYLTSKKVDLSIFKEIEDLEIKFLA